MGATLRQIAVHSLSWLVVGNLVGMLLATLLLVPQLGAWMAPWGYGRWMPVHLNLMLYGWCALPMVGLLMRFLLPPETSGRAPRLALGAWSAALVCGAADWLGGRSSGKPFLDWQGMGRVLFLTSLVILAGVLLAQSVRVRGPKRGARLALLAALVTVPGMLAWASSPGVYPPINPESGGATGSNILGSTLVLVAVFWAFPFLLGRESSDGGRTARQTLVLLTLHVAVFVALGPGEHSHHESTQILALLSLALWVPLLARHWRRFNWPTQSRAWRLSLALWASLLVADGVITFLPGILER